MPLFDLGYTEDVSQLSDTHPEIERLMIERLRELSPARRWALVGGLNRTLRTLALSDLRHLHPQASEAELRVRLAHRLYGSELATGIYGPLPGE